MHDSHGDRTSTNSGPIAMVHLKPSVTSEVATGVPVTFTSQNVVFTAKAAASNWAKTSAPFNGICNVCHTYKVDDPNKMVHYTATSSDSHRSTTLCTQCHTHSPDTTYDGFAYKGEPKVCDGCHGGNNNGNLSVGTTVGHAVHYNQATVFNNLTGSNKTTATAFGFACKNCHPTSLHNEEDGRADIVAGANYTYGGTTSTDAAGYTYTTGGTCATNQCHQDGRGGAARTPSVTWTAAKSSNNCGICHGNPPLYGISSSAHRGQTPTTSCNGCHNNVSATGTILNFLLHLNGSIEGPGCVSCHSKPITRSKGRPGKQLSQITGTGGEFGLAWGHKKSTRGAVTDADCIVCHLEGSYATGKRSTYHQDGNIDLRDPDGSDETPITNMSGAGWTFQRFSTSYAAGTRTTSGHNANTIDNIITQKFCLKCHDSNGASNTTARSGTGATRYMPFGGVSLGSNYSPTNGASTQDGLINVFRQFSTANSSKHPVRGPRKAGYPTNARLAQPYNNFTRTAGTIANSVVMNCFDCHNKPTPPLTLRTVAAHGADATNYLRGVPTIPSTASSPSASNNVTLCKVCHTGYAPGGTTSHHGTGSAYRRIPTAGWFPISSTGAICAIPAAILPQSSDRYAHRMCTGLTCCRQAACRNRYVGRAIQPVHRHVSMQGRMHSYGTRR
ncbi:CxxxxCH/CxxCH domain c-type cytochrome [Geotalea toluenoxydans]|uniref:CxxxxCH/CxxCH domain c-type cytochrome n=1 Tax=Geotalea toluenoxydans TaxID=421624 RepID=UPI001FB2EEAF|nr:CxxxxCH/CxxCH domain-containing protein [Geotalea toluenoxydans]